MNLTTHPTPTRRRLRRLAIVLAATGSLGALAAANASATIDPGLYKITPGHTFTTKSLDVAGASHANGARVNQFRSHGDPNQLFRVSQAGTTPLGGTPFYRLRPQHTTGKCLDIPGASTDIGVGVQQFDCIPGNQNQQFFIAPDANGLHQIIARHSGLRLEVPGGSLDDGVQVVQALGPNPPAPPVLHEQWLFRKIPG